MLGLNRCQDLSSLFPVYIGQVGNLEDGSGMSLCLWPPLGRLDLPLEFCQVRRRDFSGLDGLSRTMQKPGLEGLQWIRRVTSITLFRPAAQFSAFDFSRYALASRSAFSHAALER